VEADVCVGGGARSLFLGDGSGEHSAQRNDAIDGPKLKREGEMMEDGVTTGCVTNVCVCGGGGLSFGTGQWQRGGR
jgi:hypothetical protein